MTISPMRIVVKATKFNRRACIGDHRRRIRWWHLELVCGHAAIRSVTRAPKRPGVSKKQREAPAPKKVRCGLCPEETAP